MFSRVLGTTLVQVTRSIAFVLLPISFIAILAWATAGSATGNTGDPLRAALWIWLGAHQIPFNLQLPPANIAGYLSYLPLGALVFPILAIRSGIARTIDRLDNDSSLLPLARTLFSVEYTVIAMLFAFFSATSAVKPVWYLIPALTLPLTLVTAATVGRRLIFGQAALYGSRVLSLLLGIASIIFGISIFMHLHMVKVLTLVLQPGILGGFLLLLLNILYIPNAVVATLGYFSGVGFAIGKGTIIAPWSFHLHSIPAFPLLGTIPSGKSLMSLFGIAIVIFTGALLASWTIALNTKILVQSLVIATIITALIGYFGSGALLTASMSAVGVSPWKFTLTIGAELGLGVLLALYVPRLGRRS
ncbi:MAG: DUF6350 family protein [Actinomycetes bacterium]